MVALNRHTLRRLLAASLLVCVAAFAPAAQATREAKMYVVQTWDGGCSGNSLAAYSFDDMVDAWYDEITNSDCWWGHCGDAYSRDGSLVNGNVINSKYADSGVVGWGADSSYLDEADAALVGWHGGDSSGVYQGSMRVNEAGDGNCTLARTEMALGNSDLEFLHLLSCHSMDDNMWSGWRSAFDGLHQMGGFHGNAWASSSRVNDYEDFADDAFSDTLADAWLDNLYDTGVGDDNVDQCPVAYGVGSSEDNVWDRMADENYEDVWSDPTPNWWGAIFFEGCNPAGESTIESDTTT